MGRLRFLAGDVAWVVVALVVGVFVAGSLNTWLGIVWVRGLASLAAGLGLAGALAIRALRFRRAVAVERRRMAERA